MDNKLNLIIPCAGYGTRFRKAGYDDYKPFIKIKGKYMIDYVLDAFPDDVKKHVIINPELFTDEQIQYLNNKGINIIEIAPHKNGPAYSIFMGKDKLPLDESFFISYVDIFWTWDFEDVRKHLENAGVIFTRRKFHPHLINNNFSAFCREKDNKLLEIREKQSFTDDWMHEPLSVGAFYVKNGNDMMKGISKDIKENNRVAGEFFPSVMFNQIENVSLYDVDFFIHWGVPEQLEDFNNWKDVIGKIDIKDKVIFKNNICSMGGLGSRMKQFDKPKALLDINGLPLFEFVLKNFYCDKNYLITVDNIAKVLPSSDNYDIINIGDQTKSQIETIKKSKDHFLDKCDFFLTSCDATGFFDIEKFKELKDEGTEAIIFSFTPSLVQNQMKGHHTYISTDGDKVTEVHIKSKKTDKDVGLAGFFWFKDGKVFEELDSMPEDENNEMCADHFLKYLVEEGKPIKHMLLDNYLHLGTIEEYLEFQFWNDFSKILK